MLAAGSQVPELVPGPTDARSAPVRPCPPPKKHRLCIASLDYISPPLPTLPPSRPYPLALAILASLHPPPAPPSPRVRRAGCGPRYRRLMTQHQEQQAATAGPWRLDKELGQVGAGVRLCPSVHSIQQLSWSADLKGQQQPPESLCILSCFRRLRV